MSIDRKAVSLAHEKRKQAWEVYQGAEEASTLEIIEWYEAAKAPVNLIKGAIELERLALSVEAKRLDSTEFSTALAKACAEAWGLKWK